ncbi:MAG TPA: tRNA pseudouridine(38-40) synthase TruA [Paracoccaceae bacterium]|nr:tRNA pseudouridine(38-40) synthase TruA [Paracoccaceae bacterium]
MPRYKLTIEYHGGPFNGWQRQQNGPSVQGALEAALARLGEHATVTGAGRTDAGVHAMAQVAHADLARDWEPFRLAQAVNHHLRPAPVAVLEAARVPEDFHARFSAVRRHYLYRIICRRAPLALEAGLAWRVGYALDIEAMREGAAALVGRHDFTTFRSTQCQAASPVKTLDEIMIERAGDEIHFRLHARSFLHNQVRSIVGTLERVGAGRWPAERVARALAARDRAACGPVAPSDGLYLAQVDYPEG